MLTVVEIVMLVGLVIAPLITPKKKQNNVVDTDTNDAQYAINESGDIVKLNLTNRAKLTAN